jgi:hypothetical protein
MLDTSGDITIKESPRGGTGTVVTPDSPFYALIVAELAGRPATDIPGGTSAPAKAAAPSGRASAMEKETYADDLLGPVEKAGQYGSASPMSGGAVLPGASSSAVESAAKGLMSTGVTAQEAYRMVGDAQKGANADTILKTFADLSKGPASSRASAPAAPAPMPTGSAAGRMVEDAAQGLIRNGMSKQQAYQTVSEIQKQSGAADILKNLAAIKGLSGGPRPVSQSALSRGIGESGRGSR